MKLLIATMFVGLASMAQAAFIQCAPAQADVVSSGVGTSANFTCSPGAGVSFGSFDDNLAGDGFNVDQIRFRISGTFQENNAVIGQNYSVLFQVTGDDSAFANVVASCTASGTGDVNNQALGNCVATTSLANLIGGSVDVVPTFIVTVQGTNGSTPLPFNASASFLYEVTASDPSQVPEPATFALIGAGLLGAAFLRRRK